MVFTLLQTRISPILRKQPRQISLVSRQQFRTQGELILVMCARYHSQKIIKLEISLIYKNYHLLLVKVTHFVRDASFLQLSTETYILYSPLNGVEALHR